MVWDIGNVDNSGNTTWDNVGNDDNSVNLGVTLDNVGNESTTTEETNTTDVDIVDSGNVDSGNTSWDISDSGNDNSDNSDNSIDADIVVDSHNSYTDASWTDESVNAGNREYNTGFDGGYAGAGGGALAVHSSSTIVDQSVNQNVAAFGDVDQSFGNGSVTASGTGSVAAGGDVGISYSLDKSTNIDSGGDINIGNTTDVVTIDGSYNESYTDIDITDASQSWSFDNVGNDESIDVDVTDSFNDDFSSTETNDWTINADVVWGSGNETVVDLPDVDLSSGA